MGGSASSQLDESKCAYIRGTPAGGFPGARRVRPEPGARLGARAQVRERVTREVPAALPPSTAGSRAAGARMTRAHSPSPARRVPQPGGSPRRRAARRSAQVGVGCAGPGRIGSGCFGRAAGRLGNAGAGCGEGDHPPCFRHTAVFRVSSAHPNPLPPRSNTSPPCTWRGTQF